MPTPEDQLFLHLAVKYRWLDDSVARGLTRRLEEIEHQGLALTAEILCTEQGLLTATRCKALHEEVLEAMGEAETGAPAPSAPPPPAAPPRPVSSPRVATAAIPRAAGASSPRVETATGSRPGTVSSPRAETAAPAGGPAEPIPGYRILGKLGVGGMATVFRAESRDGRPVALKILLPAQAKNPVSRDRFVREAGLLTRYDHPNLVKGYQAGQHSGLFFLAMEFVDGLSVQEILDKLQVRVNATRPMQKTASAAEGEDQSAAVTASFAEDLALEVTLQAARALAYLETQGIVHRDVKPGNIMITRDGAVKLLDLGFAQPIAGGAAADGAEDVTCGTPEYMSPEQARGQHDVDIRSDIYALGASLYHMVLGEVPFKGTDSVDVMAKQVLAELYSPRVKQRVTRHMHYFLEKMMAKEKEIRYQCPKEMVTDIEAQIDGFRSLQFKRGGQPPKPAQRLSAMVVPFLPVPSAPAAAASTTRSVPRLSTGTTGLFRRPGTAPPGPPGTQRMRRLQ
jgi:serine/threonine protein kinase